MLDVCGNGLLMEGIGNPFMIEVGARLKALREGHKLTQKDLGLEFGIKKSLICMYESEDRYLPVDILVKYARKFHVSTDWILNGVDLEENTEELVSPAAKELLDIFVSLHNPMLRKVALEQLKALQQVNTL